MNHKSSHIHSNGNGDYNSFVHSIEEEARNIIKVIIPQKVSSLSSIVDDPFHELGLKESDIPHTEKRKFSDTTSDEGEQYREDHVVVTNFLLQESTQLIHILKTLKVWIKFRSKISEETSTNEVVLRKALLKHLKGHFFFAIALQDRFGLHRSRHLLYVKKYLKHPRVEDHKRALLEFNENKANDLKRYRKVLFNNYLLLYDFLEKNMPAFEKELKPMKGFIVS